MLPLRAAEPSLRIAIRAVGPLTKERKINTLVILEETFRIDVQATIMIQTLESVMTSMVANLEIENKEDKMSGTLILGLK